MRRSCFSALVFLISVADAIAGGPRMAPRGPEAGPIGGVGCYWYRQRSHCGRYCYIEADGARYCTERQRDAHSQAPAEVRLPFFMQPMK